MSYVPIAEAASARPTAVLRGRMAGRTPHGLTPWNAPVSAGAFLSVQQSC